MYGNCNFFLIKKNWKKKLLEFRDIVLNKGINKKKCFEIVIIVYNILIMF